MDPLGRGALHWCETFEDVQHTLMNLQLGRVDPYIVALAHQDGWPQLGAKYAELYRSLG
jgi:hypothetical protein